MLPRRLRPSTAQQFPATSCVTLIYAPWPPFTGFQQLELTNTAWPRLFGLLRCSVQRILDTTQSTTLGVVTGPVHTHPRNPAEMQLCTPMYDPVVRFAMYYFCGQRTQAEGLRTWPACLHPASPRGHIPRVHFSTGLHTISATSCI